jgi:uncharacterized protein (TIGR00266 family)
MKTEILCRPGNTAARLTLDPAEVVTTEGGAMIAMSGDMQIQTTTHARGKGGLLTAAKRLLGGESCLLNHYTAGAQGGELWLAPTLPGDMMDFTLGGQTLVVQAGSYVASATTVSIDVGWQGFKNLFSGESMFWLRISGQGPVVLSSYGAIYPVEVSGDYIVDTGHIVAFEETLEFELTKAGKSWVGSFLGGEGLVCRFRGRGTVWCQSHNAPAFGRTIGPLLRPA